MEKTYDLIVHERHYAVTQTQVDACERVTDPKTHETCYKVKSATTQGQSYIVRYLREIKRLVCTCPAGLTQNCWHRRAALVKERLFKEELRAQYEAARVAIESSAEYRMEVAQVTAEQAQRSYRDALKEAASGGDESAKRELKALKRYGLKAYESEDFHLEK